MADEKVKVRIKPLHNIGGVGNAGDVVWMSREEAEAYIRDGYVEEVSSSPESEPAEDHKIMKPEVRRAGRVVRKK